LTFDPAERLLAKGYSFPTGKFLSARMEIIVSPTAPVAPATATLNSLLINLTLPYFKLFVVVITLIYFTFPKEALNYPEAP
jgi:hypothetical protein